MMEVTGVQPSPFQQYYFIKSTCCEYYAISGTTTGTSLSLLETVQHLIALITLSIWNLNEYELQMHCSTVYSSLQYFQMWFSLSCAESWVHVGGGVVCQECEGEEERHHHRECLILHVCMPHKDE